MKCLSESRFKPGYTLALLMLLVLVSGCVRNEFTLEFRLPESCNSTYTIQYYGSDRRGGIAVETVVAVSAGKGELKGITRNPTVVYIFAGRRDVAACVAYAERGDKIVFEGKDDNPLEWNVTGNKVNGRLSDFKRDNRGLIGEAMQASEDTRRGIRERLNASVKKFVEANDDELASLIILTTYYDAKINPEGFLKLRSLLEKNGVAADGKKLGAAIMRQDMITSTRIAPASGVQGGDKVADMIVKSYERNLDTIKASGGKRPILIYLWRRADLDRRADIDTLRRLAGWRGDSAGMPMVDICLDSDSSTWTYAVKDDSLRRVLHVWMPRGIADENLMRLGVNGTPWWVVIGPDGRLKYSDRDGEAAIKKFKTWKK
ncbi:MAG: hypothetical protein K2H35_04640 [Muribaculaceae bacterium]|nr:hypothetical protein [Muribaculaceae bacterium]MDE6558556.1 hypothetical protein [Muribaculaceae bacterium]